MATFCLLKSSPRIRPSLPCGHQPFASLAKRRLETSTPDKLFDTNVQTGTSLGARYLPALPPRACQVSREAGIHKPGAARQSPASAWNIPSSSPVLVAAPGHLSVGAQTPKHMDPVSQHSDVLPDARCRPLQAKSRYRETRAWIET